MFWSFYDWTTTRSAQATTAVKGYALTVRVPTPAEIHRFDELPPSNTLCALGGRWAPAWSRRSNRAAAAWFRGAGRATQ